MKNIIINGVAAFGGLIILLTIVPAIFSMPYYVLIGLVYTVTNYFMNF